MILDGEISVVDFDVQHPEDENYIVVIMVMGMALPMAQPGSQQPIVVPAGRLHFKISKEVAELRGQKLLDLAENLNPESDLTVVPDLSQVETQKKIMDEFRKDKE